VTRFSRPYYQDPGNEVGKYLDIKRYLGIYVWILQVENGGCVLKSQMFINTIIIVTNNGIQQNFETQRVTTAESENHCKFLL
jgi:hypothetical protein